MKKTMPALMIASVADGTPTKAPARLEAFEAELHLVTGGIPTPGSIPGRTTTARNDTSGGEIEDDYLP
jgi:hypothetical protein